MAKRKPKDSPGYEDLDRLSENMQNNGYFPDDDNELRRDMKLYFNDEIPRQLYTPEKRKQLLKFMLFKRGGGKSLAKDKLYTSKTVYPNTASGRERYDDVSSQRADLAGVDTKGKVIPRRPKRQKPTREFTQYGVVKGRVVRVRETTVTIKGKKIKRFINKDGKFAKVTNRKK